MPASLDMQAFVPGCPVPYMYLPIHTPCRFHRHGVLPPHEIVLSLPLPSHPHDSWHGFRGLRARRVGLDVGLGGVRVAGGLRLMG